ncbi:MAG: hypothetical protein ABL973_15315 [Micropepsaceae bacterium]
MTDVLEHDAGRKLFADVLKYELFGNHRVGSPGARLALEWIAAELSRAGLVVSSQDFVVPRQYEFENGVLLTGSGSCPVVPHWWPPESHSSFELTAPVASSGSARGKFALATLAYDQGAYLGAAQRATLEAAFAREPAAVLLTIEHPSSEIFTYNVSQEDRPWPVPVILVAPRDQPLLKTAQTSGQQITVRVNGAYHHKVAARNVIGQCNGGAKRSIVISTPVTSWFTSTCERGPGIACLLAIARQVNTRWPRANFIFAATSGHEVGHGGMEKFIECGAPTPEATDVWIHLGASLACYGWHSEAGQWVRDDVVDVRRRVMLRSQEIAGIANRCFSSIGGMTLTGEAAAVGELREVHRAGYERFVGMAGSHTFFHTPTDNSGTTGAEILSPVLAAFEQLIDVVTAC